MRISIEPFHMYQLSKHSDDELVRLFRSVLPVLSMLVEGLTDRAEVYFSILLNESETDVSLMGGSIVDLANRVDGLWRHTITNSRCASLETQVVAESRLSYFAESLLTDVVRSPATGEGSVGYGEFRKKLGSNAASLSGTQYLKNYVELEELRPASALPLERRTLTKSVEPLLSLDDLTQHAGIGVVCQLYTDLHSDDTDGVTLEFSCAFLAATWQLYRLGYFDVERIGESTSGRQAQSAVIVGEVRKSDRTLTLLDPSFVSVEHAVRLILRHVVPGKPHGTGADDWLKRIAYMFLPRDWIDRTV